METFVAFCGMVGLRAKVLGRLGTEVSPHPGACALSCPSRAVYGPGSYYYYYFVNYWRPAEKALFERFLEGKSQYLGPILSLFDPNSRNIGLHSLLI
jgi:hypothetical protein